MKKEKYKVLEGRNEHGEFEADIKHLTNAYKDFCLYYFGKDLTKEEINKVENLLRYGEM